MVGGSGPQPCLPQTFHGDHSDDLWNRTYARESNYYCGSYTNGSHSAIQLTGYNDGGRAGRDSISIFPSVPFHPWAQSFHSLVLKVPMSHVLPFPFYQLPSKSSLIQNPALGITLYGPWGNKICPCLIPIWKPWKRLCFWRALPSRCTKSKTSSSVTTKQTHSTRPRLTSLEANRKGPPAWQISSPQE